MLRIPSLALALAVALVAGSACRGALELVPSDAPTVLSRQVLDAPHPGRPGPHGVLTLYYGSGQDKHRPEYRDSVSIRTEPVDASKLVDLRDRARERNRYWGFTPEELPRNARVWHPEGEGPFPLVLVVHGNHDMKDFSDPGYAWLGELLASRGFIVASVDMNFLNGAIRDENDARGWMLLQHLALFREWNGTEENPFYGRVDMDAIALIGHSRGGEAVGHAAAFNHLRHYPDDATLTFDFGFGLRSIVAIAPVDGQYLPADRKVPVADVSYLVFHGSHDGDVTSFHGLRLYDRLSFTGDAPRLKTAIYVYRANHGQWNTVWGAHDSGPRSARILDLRGLMEGEEQREFGRVYISAFLEVTLRKDDRYLPLFRDHRVAGGWLPPTMYVTRFRTSAFRPLATFEEDIDLTTGTEAGVTLRGDSLAVWREADLPLRSRNRPETSSSQENQAVWLGWNNRLAGEDTTRTGPPGAFVVGLPDDLAARWGLDPSWTLDLDLAPTTDVPPPRAAPGDADRGGQGEGRRDRGRTRDDADTRERPPMDLTVRVLDGRGREAGVLLSRYGAVRPPLEMRILRRRDMERQRFERRWELLLQTYSIPLADFTEVSPDLDLSSIREVRLVFDRTAAGTVVVDDIGFSALDPSYLRARLP